MYKKSLQPCVFYIAPERLYLQTKKEKRLYLILNTCFKICDYVL